jgi:hypothetical protein
LWLMGWFDVIGWGVSASLALLPRSRCQTPAAVSTISAINTPQGFARRLSLLLIIGQCDPLWRFSSERLVFCRELTLAASMLKHV